jgi:DNA-binding MurR/RpiR family transcriptional regulator
MPKSSAKSIAQCMQDQFVQFTKSERQLVNSLLDNYPVSCLGSITMVASTAQVSTPTVLRMVKKMGYKGFPDFQSAVKGELEEKISSPITKHDRWSESAADTHILNKFADAVMDNMRQSLQQVDPQVFDQVVDLLANDNNSLHIVGGRISQALANYFFTHMQVMRKQTHLLAASSNTWPHYLINMNEGDLLVCFDVRRYEHNLLNLVQQASQRGIKVILFTDQWGSPASKHASHTFNLRIEVPSAWDSSVVPMFMLEALISAVQDKTWDHTKERIADLESLFDETRLFQKFRS